MKSATETVREFFAQYGWEYEEIDEHNWVTGFQGEHKLYHIYVRMTEDWILLSIAPFVPRPTIDHKAEVYAQLMQANYEMTLAKFCVDPEGDVVLAVELPRENLPYAAFSTALDALSFYPDEYYPALLEFMGLSVKSSLTTSTEEDEQIG